MNSRERVIASINHRTPDRVPIDLGSTRTSGISIFSYDHLKRFLNLGEIAGTPTEAGAGKVIDVYQMLAYVEPEIVDRLHIDVLMAPKLSHRLQTKLSGWSPSRLPNGYSVLMPDGYDPVVGPAGDVRLSDTDGSVARLPKDGYYFDYLEETIPPAAKNVDMISFGDWSDEDYRFCEESARRLYLETDKALVGDFGVSLGKPSSFEEWLIGLAGDPAYIKEFNDKKSAHIVGLLEMYAQAMGDSIQIIFFGQDFGTQNGELIGPPMFQDLFAPYFSRIFSWIHEHTKWKVFFHCCGSIYNLIPIFIECGVDILNPVQCSAARMDPQTLKTEFGDRITFWGGGIDTQKVLPFGSIEEIQNQVKERIEIFGAQGGFVFTTVHNIQASIPPENIAACFDAAFEHGDLGYSSKV